MSEELVAPEVDVEPTAEEEAPADAVVILKTVDEQGNISTDVFTQGTVQATEVQTLIELGLVSWRRKIGLK